MDDNITMGAKQLPSAEEYRQKFNVDTMYLNQVEYSEPKYKCPMCEDGGMCRYEMAVYMSNPPKYRYNCNKCGYIEWQLG